MQYFKAIKAHFRAGNLFNAIIAIRTDAVIMIASMMAIGFSVIIHLAGAARLITHFVFSALTPNGYKIDAGFSFFISVSDDDGQNVLI